MTKVLSTLVLALALAAFTGCKKEESPTVSGQVSTIDTSSAEQKFQSAEPEVRGDLDKAVTAIKGGNYTEALDKLKSLASNAKLTPEQQQAAKDLLAQVQKAITSGAEKAVEGAGKALDDVKKALPK